MAEDFKTTDVKDTPTLLRTLAALTRPLTSPETAALCSIADAFDATAKFTSQAYGLKSTRHEVPLFSEMQEAIGNEAADRFGAALAGAFGAQLCATTGYADVPPRFSPFLDALGDGIAEAYRLAERLVVSSETTAQASFRMVELSEPPPEPINFPPLETPPANDQDCARAELIELDARVTKLAAFVSGEAFAALPSPEKRLLWDQHDGMTAYAVALSQRIKLWEEREAAAQAPSPATQNRGDTQADRERDTIEAKDVGTMPKDIA